MLPSRLDLREGCTRDTRGERGVSWVRDNEVGPPCPPPCLPQSLSPGLDPVHTDGSKAQEDVKPASKEHLGFLKKISSFQTGKTLKQKIRKHKHLIRVAKLRKGKWTLN